MSVVSHPKAEATGLAADSTETCAASSSAETSLPPRLFIDNSGKYFQVNPILFLDVDGPLNLWGRAGRRILNPLLSSRLVRLKEDGSLNVNLVFSRLLGARLRGLAKHYEICWATSWNQWANQYLSPLLGIPQDLPWLNCPNGDPRSKFSEVITSAETNSFAWVDDFLTEEVAEALQEKLHPAQSALLISPHIMCGIDHEVAHLLKWFSKMQETGCEPGRLEVRKAAAILTSRRVAAWLVTPGMVTCLSSRKGRS